MDLSSFLRRWWEMQARLVEVEHARPRIGSRRRPSCLKGRSSKLTENWWTARESCRPCNICSRCSRSGTLAHQWGPRHTSRRQIWCRAGEWTSRLMHLTWNSRISQWRSRGPRSSSITTAQGSWRPSMIPLQPSTVLNYMLLLSFFHPHLQHTPSKTPNSSFHCQLKTRSISSSHRISIHW